MDERETAAGVMPVGQTMSLPIRESQVIVTEGNEAAPNFDDDATATLVWENYNTARNYVENNAWLLEWQEADYLSQSPIPNRFMRVEQGRPARVPDFMVAKMSRTMARAVRRAVFAEQTFFMLRPKGKTSQIQADAWTELITTLSRRAKFQYNGSLLINCQTLQGTGIGKMGVEKREVWRRHRRRKEQPVKVPLPSGQEKQVPTTTSDDFEVVEEKAIESWPFFEYRRLGTTLYDPKWCTPDDPDESAGYCIDVDYVNFGDLQEMRKLDCYKNIPDEATLKSYFFQRQEGSAPVGSQIEDAMTSQGSMVVHAEARNRTTDKSPLNSVLMLLEQWDKRTVKTILVYEGRKLTIRNDEHKFDSLCHPTATWWPIDNAGYGMGIGRINGPDQRIRQGVKNESLKMLAYPFNAPLVVPRGDNAPTQNVINRMGGFWQVDLPPGGDYRKSVGFLPMPEVPADAWKMLAMVQQEAEQNSGASQQFQQGNLGGPGSSAARTATGANRIAGMSDQSVADPVESFAEGVIVPWVKFLMSWTKEEMPLQEIREILSDKYAAVIEAAIDEEDFLNAEFEVSVLAGQKLAAKSGIQQLIPLFLQIVQQPQLLEYLHQRGETIDFGVMMDLMMQVSELQQQPDIFRPLTDAEKQQLQQMNPGMQKVQAAATVEKLKGANKQAEIQTKGQVDLANKAAEIAMERTADGIPMMRAEGLLERGEDEAALKNGLPDMMQQ